ncbi:MAG: RNA polymerase sigma factor [Planctomycetota bacterium]
MGVPARPTRGLAPADRRLLDQLIVELGPRLRAYIRHLAHPQDVEDLVAESFCRAAANMGAVRATGRRDLYFLTIARNLCRDRIRRRRLPNVPPEMLDQESPAPDLSADLARAEELDALRAAVASLPETLREVVVLRIATRLRFEEIAELLNVPLGTALSRMHDAVRHLRNTLGVVHERP